MASFAVDGKRQAMVATGIVEVTTEWGQDASGRRFRTDTQSVDERTGLPVWGVEVTYRESSFGRESTVTAKVQVPLAKEPAPGFMTPIVFSGLVAEVRVNRQSGAQITSWRAEGVESMSGGAAAPAAHVASGKDAKAAA